MRWFFFILSALGGLICLHTLLPDVLNDNRLCCAEGSCGTAVTTDPSFQSYPQIWEDKIIWVDSRLGPQDLFLYDISQGLEKPLTQTPYPEAFPDIYENKVIYQVWRKNNYDIWFIDLATGKAQPVSEGEDWHEMLPKIWGDLVVWEDWRNSYKEGDIYLHNLKTGKTEPLVQRPAAQGRPDIYEDKIVWHDKRNGNWDIYLYDLSKGEERPLTEDPSDQFSPVIHGNHVVWVDTRNGNWDIYLYDLTTDTTRCLCQEPSKQWWPQVWGDTVLWVDERGGESIIYLYNLKNNQEKPLCTSAPAPQRQPSLYKDRIAWMDLRNGESTTPGTGNWDIYTTSTLPLFRITASLSSGGRACSAKEQNHDSIVAPNF